MEQFGKLVESTALHEWMLTTEWLWPWLEIIHFFGLSLLLGALLVIDLRMAGFFPSDKYQGNAFTAALGICRFWLECGDRGALFLWRPNAVCHQHWIPV